MCFMYISLGGAPVIVSPPPPFPFTQTSHSPTPPPPPSDRVTFSYLERPECFTTRHLLVPREGGDRPPPGSSDEADASIRSVSTVPPTIGSVTCSPVPVSIRISILCRRLDAPHPPPPTPQRSDPEPIPSKWKLTGDERLWWSREVAPMTDGALN